MIVINPIWSRRVMDSDHWLEQFRNDAVPAIIHYFKPEKIIVFGSRARGRATEDSDIDIIVISDLFRDIPFLERMPLMMKLVPFPKHIDYLCYTVEEFDRIRNTSSLIIDAMSDPLEIAVT